MKHLLYFIFIFINLLGLSQTRSTTFVGFFRGENLNIQCRDSVTAPYAYCECIDSIAVNGKVIPDLLYQKYQLDIANKVDLKIYEKFSVTFYYTLCDFRVTNSSSFYPKEILPVADFHPEGNTLYWTTLQNYPDLHFWVQIEQYKWDRWVKIGENHNVGDSSHFSMDIEPYLFNGENKFRAVVATIDRDRTPSIEEVTIQHKGKKTKCKWDKKNEVIKFSRPTHYELYNSKWLIAKRGFGNTIDIKGLRPDEYIVKYANKEFIFTIK